MVDIFEAHVLALEYLRRGGSCSWNVANARGSVRKVIPQLNVAVDSKLVGRRVGMVIRPF